MMKHLKQLHGIRGLLPYLKTKRPTVLLIFFLSVIDAGLSLLPIQIIAAVVDLLSTGRSVFSPILGTSLTLHLVFFGGVRVEACGQPRIRSYEYHAVDRDHRIAARRRYGVGAGVLQAV